MARYYHDNNVGIPVAQGNQVLMNGTSLVTLSSADKAVTMEQDLKAAIDSKSSKKVKADDKSKADKKDKKAKVKADTKVKTDNTAASKANFE